MLHTKTPTIKCYIGRHIMLGTYFLTTFAAFFGVIFLSDSCGWYNQVHYVFVLEDSVPLNAHTHTLCPDQLQQEASSSSSSSNSNNRWRGQEPHPPRSRSRPSGQSTTDRWAITTSRPASQASSSRASNLPLPLPTTRCGGK